MYNDKVLIVGAGPVGLSLALLLKKFEIPFEIIEKETIWSDKSKAMTLTARTLELLNMLGVADKLVNAGIKVKYINYHYGKIKLGRADFSQLDSKYNFLLQLPQPKLQQLLYETLVSQGVNVEFNNQLKSFTRSDHGIDCQIENTMKNYIYHIQAKYLLACDGAHSTVRTLDGMGFAGDDDSEKFLMVDLPISNLNLVFEERYLYYLKKRSFFYIMPIERRNNQNIYRIITTRDSRREYDSDMILSIFSKLFSSIGFSELKFGEPDWISTFNPRQYIVEHFYYDKVVYLGDAAHIQSPIGSQGINTGIQDAFNFAWRLNNIFKYNTNELVLYEYDKERRPIAKQLLDMNNKISGTVFRYNAMKRFFSIMPKTFLKLPKKNAREIEAISQLKVHYDKNMIRLPNLKTISGESIYDLLSPTTFNIVLFGSSLEKVVSTHYPELNILCVTKHDKQQLQGLLVRPDGYVERFISNWKTDLAFICKS